MCGKCENWVFGVLGLVVLVTPFLGLDAQLSQWIYVVAGLVIAALGFWGAWKGCAFLKGKTAPPA